MTMYSMKVLFCAIMVAACSARHLVWDDHSYYWIPEEALEELQPVTVARTRRQAHGSAVFNSDGTSGANVKVPLVGNDKTVLSAIGAAGFNDQHKLSSATAGLALDNVNGHGLTLTRTNIPGMGHRDAAAANVNLLNNGAHKVDANAFAARTFPNHPQVPNFNTYGGGVDYMFKDKIGAGVSVAQTPLFQKTDYGATGKLNLFHNRDSSLDFNAGLSKSVSPFIPKSSWEPNFGFSFRKFF